MTVLHQRLSCLERARESFVVAEKMIQLDTEIIALTAITDASECPEASYILTELHLYQKK